MSAQEGKPPGKLKVVYLQLGLGMAAFGSATPISKIVTGAMPVFVGSILRVLLGALVLLPVAFRHRATVRELERREWVLIVLIALFGMFGFSALMLYGMRMITGVAGAIIMSTAPAITAAASMVFLGDRPTWRKVTAIALAVAGVLLLHLGREGDGNDGGDPDDMLAGGAFILAAVCCEAAYTLLGKAASKAVDPVLVAFLAAVFALPMFLPFAIWQITDFTFAEVGVRAWIAMAWYGAGTLAIGSWLWYSGVAKAEGSVAAAFMGIMPVSALLLSYVLLGEAFRWTHLAGFTIVFSGVLLMSWEHARMSETNSSSP